jgi:hypothetical protein
MNKSGARQRCEELAVEVALDPLLLDRFLISYLAVNTDEQRSPWHSHWTLTCWSSTSRPLVWTGHPRRGSGQHRPAST